MRRVPFVLSDDARSRRPSRGRRGELWAFTLPFVAHFRYYFVSEGRGSLTPNRRDVTLDFEKKKRLVDLGHGIIRRDAFRFFAESQFSGKVLELLK